MSLSVSVRPRPFPQAVDPGLALSDWLGRHRMMTCWGRGEWGGAFAVRGMGVESTPLTVYILLTVDTKCSFQMFPFLRINNLKVCGQGFHIDSVTYFISLFQTLDTSWLDLPPMNKDLETNHRKRGRRDFQVTEGKRRGRKR